MASESPRQPRESVVVVAEADSTTYPFSSPLRRSESLWSLETVPVEWNQLQEPDSTTSPPSSSSTTPDNLSENLLEGYNRLDIINWVNEHGGNMEVENGIDEPDDLDAMDIPPPSPPPPDGEENGVENNFNV